MKNIIKKIKSSDFITVFFFDMIVKFFTVIISILIIRCLTKTDYAVYTLFNSIGSFISGVLGSGVGLAYTRYAVQLRQQKNGEENNLYCVLRKWMILIGGVIVIGGSCILAFIDKHEFNIIAGLMYGVLLANYQLNTVFFQAKEKYSIGGAVSNIKNIIVAVVIFGVFALQRKMQVDYLLIIYLLAMICSWMITVVYINRNFLAKENHEMIINKKSNILRLMLKESIWIILYMFMISAFNQIDVLILNYKCQQIDVATYGVAFKYYSLILSLLPSLQVVLRVRNSRAEMLESEELRRISVMNWIKKSTPIAVGLFVLGIFFARVLFPILNGNDYNDSIEIFNILLIGACLSYITAPNVSVMLAAGKQKILFILSVGAFLINLIGNWMFIPLYGGIAAAITTVIAHFFLNGGSTVILLKSKQREKC